MTVRQLLAALAALTLFFAACGSDDGSGDVEVSQDGGSDDADSGGSGEGDIQLPDGTDIEFGFDAENCAALEAAFDDIPLSDGLGTGDDPTADLEASADYFESIVDEVPSEIQGDIQTLADAFAGAAEVSSGVDWEAIAAGDPGAAQDALQLATEFASADLLGATTNLTRFLAENCIGQPG